jgi:hypothetical protein
VDITLEGAVSETPKHTVSALSGIFEQVAHCNSNLKKNSLNLKLLLLQPRTGAQAVVVVVVKAHDLTIHKGK